MRPMGRQLHSERQAEVRQLLRRSRLQLRSPLARKQVSMQETGHPRSLGGATLLQTYQTLRQEKKATTENNKLLSADTSFRASNHLI